MATVQITADNFADTIEKGGIVLLDWWAPWCGPCRAFGPVFERVSAAYPDIVFGKINTEEEQELAAQFEIQSIPTLMIIRDKTLIFAQPGMLPEKVLKDVVDKVRALDMNTVLKDAKAAKPRVATA